MQIYGINGKVKKIDVETEPTLGRALSASASRSSMGLYNFKINLKNFLHSPLSINIVQGYCFRERSNNTHDFNSLNLSKTWLRSFYLPLALFSRMLKTSSSLQQKGMIVKIFVLQPT